MPNNYHLRIYPSRILRQHCHEVEDFSGLDILLKSMKELMYNLRGEGLAAPQIGDSRRVVVANAGDGLYEFINPIITSSRGYQVSFESCLSVLHRPALCLRSKEVTVAYQDRYSNHHERTYGGFEAVLMQHEIDHLDGRLMTDLRWPPRI